MRADVSLQGWSLPLRLDAEGALPRRRNAPMEDAIRLIVEVRLGERPLLPEFGCRVHDLDSLDSTEKREVAAVLIEEALERWGPSLRVRRVRVLEVTRSPDDDRTDEQQSTATLTLEVSREQSTFVIDVLWFGGTR